MAALQSVSTLNDLTWSIGYYDTTYGLCPTYQSFSHAMLSLKEVTLQCLKFLVSVVITGSYSYLLFFYGCFYLFTIYILSIVNKKYTLPSAYAKVMIFVFIQFPSYFFHGHCNLISLL